MNLSEARSELATLLDRHEAPRDAPSVEAHAAMLDLAGYQVTVESGVSTIQGNRVLELRGTILDADGRDVGMLRRYYDPINRVAKHHSIDVYGAPGDGIAPQLWFRAIRHLEAMGYLLVTFSAEAPLGRGYWARFPVAFAGGETGPHAGAVRQWFERWLPTWEESMPSGDRPRDYWRVGWSREQDRPASIVSLREVARSIGQDGAAEGLVERRGSDSSHLGEALLLLGPDWKGTLELGSIAARSMEHMMTKSMGAAAGRRDPVTP